MTEQDQPQTPPPPPEAPGSEAPAEMPEPTSDDRTMAMLCHLLAIFTGFLGPLILWLVKKDQSAFVDDQGKEAMNFQLTVLIGYVISAATVCIGIGAILGPVVVVANLVFCILGTLDANKGNRYRYKICIRFIK